MAGEFLGLVILIRQCHLHPEWLVLMIRQSLAERRVRDNPQDSDKNRVGAHVGMIKKSGAVAPLWVQ